MKLRDYQRAAVDNTLALLNDGTNCISQMATGLGKTVVIGGVVHRFDGTVLVQVHRQEIVHQIAETLHRITGEAIGIEMAGERVSKLFAPRIIVGTVQTLTRRLSKYDPSDRDLVITDEGHHTPAESYNRVHQHFNALRYGVTATMMRADGVGYQGIYDEVSANLDMLWAIQNGWLVPIRQQIVPAEVDLRSIKRVAGDFHRRQLSHELERYEAIHSMAHPIVEIAGDRQAIIFCATVEHAKVMAEFINRHRPGTAAHITGKHNQENRDAIIRGYREGDIQFLCNVGVATEGFDAPGTGIVAMCRPFIRPKHLHCSPLYAQCVGRVTRPLPGVVDGPESPEDRRMAILGSDKPYGLVIDFSCTAGNHTLSSAVDLDGRPRSATARDRVGSREDGAEVDVFDEIDRELLLELERRREEHRRRGDWIKVRAKYEREDVDPFAVRTEPEFKPRTPPTHTFMVPKTDAQIQYMRDLNLNPNDYRSKGHAMMAISKALHERGRG